MTNSLIRIPLKQFMKATSVVTTDNYWLQNKRKNKQEKGRAATRPFFVIL